MKEKPILFSAPMVRAILEGRKTVTRRMVKFNIAGRIGKLSNQWHVEDPGAVAACPHGQPGDRLWVREAFALESCIDGEGDPPFNDGRPVKHRPDDDFEGAHVLWTQAHYRATDPAPDLCCERPNCEQCREHGMGPHWRPSIHMPRWASRLTLEVTRVRVERLQDITEQQALEEGVKQCDGGAWDYLANDWAQGYSPRSSFGSLWQSINGAGSWAANPWVWVIDFKQIKAVA